MTNPQEPQNPISERRQRPATGVTFDEMIAIVVAFSTIGAILFWSLGGRRGGIANNFLGTGNSSFLIGKDIAANIADSDAELNFGNLESESDRLQIARDLPESKSSVVLAPSSEESAVLKLKTQSYDFDPGIKYAPLTGIATLPTFTNNRNLNQGIVTEEIEIEEVETEDVEVEVKTPVADAPKAKVDKEVKTPVADAPKKTPSQTEMPDDITPSYWAYPFVKKMNEQLEIPEFADDQNFEPDKLITRAGMATLISQAFDMQPENESIKKFKDVSNKNAIAADVDKAVRLGFMQGYSKDEFRPLENIPRYQVLVTLATGLGLKASQNPTQILNKFGDASDLPNWAKEQVAAAAEAGLIVNAPDANNSLNPNQAATRAEVAAMIHQALVKTGKLQPLESERIVR